MTPGRPPLKVAYVLGTLGVGGAERQLLCKVPLMRKFGVEVVVISLTTGGLLADAFRAFGCRVYEIERRYSYDMMRFTELTRVLRLERPHILQTEMYDAGAHGRLAAQFARVPIIVQTIRSAFPSLRPRYRILEMGLRHITDSYLVNAKAIRDSAVRLHGLDPNDVHVVYNLIDETVVATRTREDVRAELGLTDDQIAVGLVASFSPEKNHPLFLDFARQLHERVPNTRFFVIGDGAERPTIEAEIARHGIADIVTLTGMRDDVPDLLLGLDLSTNCSVREGLCNALLESILAGVPVLATEVGGTPELITRGVHGEMFPSESSTEMREQAELMLPKLATYRQAIAEDLPRIRRMFDAAHVTEQELQIYLDALAKEGIEPAHPNFSLVERTS